MDRTEQLEEINDLIEELSELDQEADKIKEKLKNDPLFTSYNLNVTATSEIEEKLREKIKLLEPDNDGKRDIEHAGYHVYMQKRDKKTFNWDIEKLRQYRWAEDVFKHIIDEKKLIGMAKVLGIDIKTLYTSVSVDDQSYPVIKKLVPAE